MAYFYFTFNDSEKQTTNNFLTSLIFQFWKKDDTVPPALKSLYGAYSNGQHQATIDDLMLTLRALVSEFSHAYIIVDAVDECAEPQAILKLLVYMKQWELSSLHILVASRRERIIEITLKDIMVTSVDIQSVDTNRDIHEYIDGRLHNDREFVKWSEDIRQEIVDSLMNGAHGM